MITMATLQSLPVEPGMWYRLHKNGVPFDAAHATSAPLYPPPPGTFSPEFEERWMKPHPGYSAFANPWHLEDYVNDMHFDTSMGKVIRFRGTATGDQGGDGEPLVMPTGGILESMSWDDFSMRNDFTGYSGDWEDEIRQYEW